VLAKYFPTPWIDLHLPGDVMPSTLEAKIDASDATEQTTYQHVAVFGRDDAAMPPAPVPQSGSVF
jgi:hypothetical protein